MPGLGFTNIGKFIRMGENAVDESESAAKFVSKYGDEALEAGSKARRVAEDIRKENNFETVEDMITNMNEGLARKLDELIDAEKGITIDRSLLSIEQKLEDTMTAVSEIKKISKLQKRTKWAKRFAKGVTGVAAVGVGAEYLADNYVMPEYDELKRNCQCTCQGFNKVNLNDEKWEKLNKILYCRNDGGLPCELEDGECPTGCTLHNNNKKSASLYGNTDDNFISSSPQYTNWKGDDNTFCPLNNDSEFKDDFLNYHTQRALEVVGAGVASGATLDTVFGSGMIDGLGGGVTAAAAGEFIPSEFPGHCLDRLFNTSEYKTDPTLPASDDSHQDLKVVKCQGDISTVEPDGDGRRIKCSLREGEEGQIISSESQMGYDNNRELGTCVAWNKSDGGKCMSVSHAPEHAYEGALQSAGYMDDINCSSFNDEGSCEGSEFCYWHNENHFNDIYMCLNDVTLIKMHNDILDGGADKNLISELGGVSQSPTTKINNDSLKITSLENYNSGKETDINDICNAYCNESLCNNPFVLTMPAIPFLNEAIDGLKSLLKMAIFLLLSLFIYIACSSMNFFKNIYKSRKNNDSQDGDDDDDTSVSPSGGSSRFSWIKIIIIIFSICSSYIITYHFDFTSEFIDNIINDKILPFIEENI